MTPRTQRTDTKNFAVVTPMFMPKVGQSLVVELPGERLLTSVAKVLSPDIVIVEVTTQPMARTHQHKKGEFVPVERHFNGLETVWREYSMVARHGIPKVKVPAADPPKKKRSVRGSGKNAAKTG